MRSSAVMAMESLSPVAPGVAPALMAPVSTLFFPVSGNPIGFNHFATAEWMLRSNPEWRHVVLVLSNGRHPDPTKADAEVDANTRLAIVQAAVAHIQDPEQSFMARQAALAGDRLRLTPERLVVDTQEFAYKAPVRTAQLINALKEKYRDEEEATGRPLRFHWCVGTDLVRRMADPAIFSDADLRVLSGFCNFAIMERESDPAPNAVRMVKERRGVTLVHHTFPLADVPAWLAPFLLISSTLMRHAAQAGDPLGAMLPRPAAEIIASRELYRVGRPVANLVAPSGAVLGNRTALQLVWEGLQSQLDAEATGLTTLLAERHAQDLPHGLAVGEGCVGGVLTAALARRAGASRFFRQARFFYDREAKVELLGELPEHFSAVTPEAVTALARALRAQSQADYALVESGMAGPPDGIRRSLKNGQTWLAVAGPQGVETELVSLNPFLTRREHMLLFSRRAIALLQRVLKPPAS
ncbi:MAG TPA: CinA family protein [bacterium]|nr:CinA family protein [bacterium]